MKKEIKKEIANKMLTSKQVKRSFEKGTQHRLNQEGASPVLKSVLRHNQKEFKHNRAFAKGRM